MLDTQPIRFVAAARARQSSGNTMDKLKIRGGAPLRGEIPVAGAKNAIDFASKVKTVGAPWRESRAFSTAPVVTG